MLSSESLLTAAVIATACLAFAAFAVTVLAAIVPV
jgi:hypothetical protein